MFCQRHYKLLNSPPHPPNTHTDIHTPQSEVHNSFFTANFRREKNNLDLHRPLLWQARAPETMTQTSKAFFRFYKKLFPPCFRACLRSPITTQFSRRHDFVWQADNLTSHSTEQFVRSPPSPIPAREINLPPSASARVTIICLKVFWASFAPRDFKEREREGEREREEGREGGKSVCLYVIRTIIAPWGSGLCLHTKGKQIMLEWVKLSIEMIGWNRKCWCREPRAKFTSTLWGRMKSRQ